MKISIVVLMTKYRQKETQGYSWDVEELSSIRKCLYYSKKRHTEKKTDTCLPRWGRVGLSGHQCEQKNQKPLQKMKKLLFYISL